MVPDCFERSPFAFVVFDGMVKTKHGDSEGNGIISLTETGHYALPRKVSTVWMGMGKHGTLGNGSSMMANRKRLVGLSRSKAIHRDRIENDFSGSNEK